MGSSAPDQVYRAISDGTRRGILDLLAGSERSVKELTAAFSISQPAISQHLLELRLAKLVVARRVHRENRYRLTGAPLGQVAAWLDKYRHLIDPAGHHWAIGAVESEDSK
jgi:DNA-binding transcriptional ArsR family regulator